MGYGIFYFYLDKIGFISSGGDFRGKGIKAYFETLKDCINNYDNNKGRWGKGKLQESNRPEYIKAYIKEVFNNEDFFSTARMWK